MKDETARRRRPRHSGWAFTLSELLIALAVLGLVAVLTVPKVLISMEAGKKKAVFKETISTMMAVVQNGRDTDAFTPATMTAFYASRLNATKVCPNNAKAEGCWTGPDLATGDSGEPGIQLANGAQLTSLNGEDAGNNVWTVDWVMDWNGASAPNVIGKDQLYLVMCVGDAECGNAFFYIPPVLHPGRVAPSLSTGDDAANAALYNSIFAN